MLIVWLAALTAFTTLTVLWPPKRFAVTSVLAFFLVLPVAEFVPLVVLSQVLGLAGFRQELLADTPAEWAAAAGFVLASSWVLLLRHYFAKVSEDAPYASRHLHLWPLWP